ncbi:hypothetical protein EV1_004330 [Malus domestica]
MQLKGLSPDSVTYGTLIDGLQRVDREEDALVVFDQMMKNGCTPSSAVYHVYAVKFYQMRAIPAIRASYHGYAGQRPRSLAGSLFAVKFCSYEGVSFGRSSLATRVGKFCMVLSFIVTCHHVDKVANFVILFVCTLDY